MLIYHGKYDEAVIQSQLFYFIGSFQWYQHLKGQHTMFKPLEVRLDSNTYKNNFIINWIFVGK